MKKITISIILQIVSLIILSPVFSQTGSINGKIINSINNQPIPFANVALEGTINGATSSEDGSYRINEIKPGVYNILVSVIGYEPKTVYEIRVNSTRPVFLNIKLDESNVSLEEIVVTKKPFSKTLESPVSLRSISAAEIYRNPGGNRDISRVIRSLPGVGTSVSFRNDIFIRGGAPNENRFYLDGIEVPNINHFATQGSSGGPVGMINVDLIRDVDFYAGAFPANRGNALSSVIEFKQKEGNNERVTTAFNVGSSDIGLTLDGPVGKKSEFMISARRSYLQFLFKALKLPFLPTYNDFQYKHVFYISPKDKITILGLAAIDDFELNKSVNDDIDDEEKIERNNYLINNLPVNTQWNYTIGGKWQHFRTNSYQTYVISRNHLNNDAIKYQYNIETPENLKLDYNSQEIENKFRFENTYRKNGYKIISGIGIENSQYKTNTYSKSTIKDKVFIYDYDSDLTMTKFGMFAQISKKFIDDRLTLSTGVRSDFNDYSDKMKNPLKQISPRFSAAYSLTPETSVNFNTGIYYQLPPYTSLGYRDNSKVLVNRDNDIKYIRVAHLVTGIEYDPTKYSKITLEGFYKKYSNYPMLVERGISLANLGADFGVIGADKVSPDSKGRSYGVELLAQQKLANKIYGILSYTFVRSEFTNEDEKYKASAWDNRHILNVTAGKKFGKNWEVGAKFRLAGGLPYTPYDMELSSKKEIWDVNQRGVHDYTKINSERLDMNHGLDVRIDKKWYIKKVSLNAYIDIQNIYNFKIKTQSDLTVITDSNGSPVDDPQKPGHYKTKLLKNESGTVLPSIGLVIEF